MMATHVRQKKEHDTQENGNKNMYKSTIVTQFDPHIHYTVKYWFFDEGRTKITKKKGERKRNMTKKEIDRSIIQHVHEVAVLLLRRLLVVQKVFAKILVDLVVASRCGLLDKCP